ncbi:succinate dehydrogenase cytochrome b subunit [Actinomycetaceae bacterium MB13-C1-2]|nr:succinate dehydrogenase cytochrome b subunit [Actinomycetaceae bacterium MB13-C1-2]
METMRLRRTRRDRLRPSSWLLKVTMAVTGLIWVAFVLIHLFGNLKVFSGAEAFDSYARWLRTAFYPFLPKGFLLWTMRIILIICLLLHVMCAYILWSRGRKRGSRTTRRSVWSRPTEGQSKIQAVSAALMPLTGVLIFAFIIIHILDLTTGTPPVATEQFVAATTETSSAYANLVASMQRPVMAGIYALTMALLAVHVFHGVRTAASDLGTTGHSWRQLFLWTAGLCALVILLGNGTIPILVQLGVIQ